MNWLDAQSLGKAAKPAKKIAPVDWSKNSFDWDLRHDKPALNKDGSPKNITIPQPTLYKRMADEPLYAKIKFFHTNIKAIGIPEPAASFATYQTYFETDRYTNRGYKDLHNAAGITFAGQSGATKSGMYADFKTWPNFFRHYKHELTKKSNPAGAKTLEEFVSRLNDNGYFEADPANYLNGLKQARTVILKVDKDLATGYGTHSAKQPKINQYEPGAGIPTYAKKDGLKWWQWGLIVTGAVIVVKKIAE